MNALAHASAAFAVGVALGGAPGPVQVVLVTEASRGGVRRGLVAMAGANFTLAGLGAVLALWLAGVTISPGLLRAIRLAGGLFLVYAGAETWASASRAHERGPGESRGSPAVRGILAVLLNPGALLFLATTGSALLASATADGGTGVALVTLAAMVAGVAVVDFVAVLLGSRGRRLSPTRRTILFRALGLVLVGIGAAFLVGAAKG